MDMSFTLSSRAETALRTGRGTSRDGQSALRSFASKTTAAKLINRDVDGTKRPANRERRQQWDPLFAIRHSLFAIQLLDKHVLFADLVVMAERLHPIPFRTRP
jgi:hypothetical protein